MSIGIDSASIQSAARRLEVISNNIANANTVGYKCSNFEDVLGNAITKAASSVQSFSQGSVATNNSPLNVAINGRGMFGVVDSQNNQTFTRDGQFSLNSLGNIVNSTGDYLTGYVADANGQLLLTGNAVKLKIQTVDSLPIATTAAKVNLNLNSKAENIPSSTTFDPTLASTYTHSTTTTVFDAKGVNHDVQSFYIKRTSTDWDVEVTVDGVKQNGPTKTAPNINTPLTTLVFDSSGKLTSLSPKGFSTTVESSTSAQVVKFDLTETVQFGSAFAASSTQDGNDIGQLTGYKIDADGVIKTQYSNGKSALMGQIVLYNFRNENGLEPTKNNQWRGTTASGPAQVGTPQANGLGSLQGSATEDSNVDLTVEMIKLISAQRAFQAASEVIKKQDEIIQGVVHLGG